MDALDWTVCNHIVGIKYHSSQAGAVQTVLMFCCVALAACTVGAWDQHRHATDCLTPGILLSHYCSLRPIRLAVFQLLYLLSFIHLLPAIYSWKCFFYFSLFQLCFNFYLMYVFTIHLPMPESKPRSSLSCIFYTHILPIT